jgi:tetratricopeptide (TPR) repeat protein
MHRARQFLQNQQYPEALNTVEQVCLIAPSYIPALTLKGQILGTMGRFPEALAVVEQLLQVNPNHALTWSMRAVLYSKTGQYRAALAAIERSLELNPGDPEAYAIKTNIMTNLQNEENSQQQQMPQSRRLSVVMGAIIQIISLLMGIAGMALPILQPRLPVTVGFFIASLGMALLCVNAARGAYRYGFLHLLSTLLLCLLVAGVMGMLSTRYYRIIGDTVQQNPQLIVPVLLFIFWLIITATMPILLALGGFMSGLVLGVRKER